MLGESLCIYILGIVCVCVMYSYVRVFRSKYIHITYTSLICALIYRTYLRVHIYT